MDPIRRTSLFFCCTLMLLAGALGHTPASAGSVTLRWTSPGDDGVVGRATRYDLRYSQLPITTANFTQALAAPGTPAPRPAGQSEIYTVPGLSPGTGYYFAIKTFDEAGNASTVSNVVFRVGQNVGVDPAGFTLSFSAPYPNPARQMARCNFTLPQSGPIEVEAFDIAGRHVRTLGSGVHPAGRGEVAWDLSDDSGRPVSTGIYLVRARIAGRTWTERLVIAR